MPPQVLAAVHDPNARSGPSWRGTAIEAGTVRGTGPRTLSDLGLTGRQADVLSLLVQGLPNKLICRELDLAEGTVKSRVANARQRLVEWLSGEAEGDEGGEADAMR